MVTSDMSDVTRYVRRRVAGWGTWRSRLLNISNIFIAIWFLVLLWGESWTFTNSINACDWKNWERWPPGATPHHLVFLADPQLVDPHSYPGRPWPLSSLTMSHTDSYMRRSYARISMKLHPDTLFFLGDLFDGGREWKTMRGNFEEPAWTKGLRPSGEQAYVKTWSQRYKEEFWLREYGRFGDMFFDLWNLGGSHSSQWQRGRRLISTIPGNHDLGFGAQVKVSVRDRFEAYFGEGNRVDVIGNHTFVSVDSVSLSAGSSNRPKKETAPISGPAEQFLHGVQAMKRRAVVRELGYLTGEERAVHHDHVVEELRDADYSHLPTLDPGPSGPDLPTILLTHVPLYRPPGTPCGPLRERSPPTKPPKGRLTPVKPDEANAISVVAGYQYQNVLGEADSIKLVSSIGNVVSVFSGDDHDYCEIVHPEKMDHAREITVKSMSYAMGIRRPGFVMLSMWNPVNEQGKPLHSVHTGHGSSESPNQVTIESHLCLLPDQLGILQWYGILAGFTILALAFRSILVEIYRHLNEDISPLPVCTKDLLPRVTSPFISWKMSTFFVKKDKSEAPYSPSHQIPAQDHSPTNSNSSTSSTSLANLAPRISTAARGRSISPGSYSGYGIPASQMQGSGGPSMVGNGHGDGKKDSYGCLEGRSSWEAEKVFEREKISRGRYTGNRVCKMRNTRQTRPGRIATETLSGVWRVIGVAGAVFLWLNLRG